MNTQKLLVEPQDKLVAELYKLFYQLGRKEYNSIYSKKIFNNLQKFVIIFLYFKSGKSLRDFLNDFKYNKFIHILQLKRIPSKSTLHNWLKEYNINDIKTILDKTLISKEFEILAIDGTGLDSLNASPYFQKKKGINMKLKDYFKLDIVIDSKTKQIVEFNVSDHYRHDSFIAKGLFRSLISKGKIPIYLVADKGYYAKHHYYLWSKYGTIYIVPPKNYKNTKHNSFFHKTMKETYEKFKEIYNQRSLVEAVFSSLKRRFKIKIRGKTSKMKELEVSWYLVVYNIDRRLNFLLKFIFGKFLEKILSLM